MADESIPPVAVGESAGASTAAPPEPAAPEATAVPAPVAALVAATADSATGTPGPGTGTTTPLLSPEEIEKSLKVSLADMTAKATAMYVHKNYEEATELFSKAAEMQAEISGDMNPANAEILFLYGRALLKVGQSKSDVFGGKAPEAAKKGKPAPKKANGDKAEAKSAAEPSSSVAVEAAKTEEPTPAERITEEGVAILAAEAGGAKKEASAEPKKPLFQFEGDGDIDDSDEEEDEQDVSLEPKRDVLWFCGQLKLTRRAISLPMKMVRVRRNWTTWEMHTKFSTWLAYSSTSSSLLSTRRHQKTRARARKREMLRRFGISRSAWPTLTTCWQRSLWRASGMFTFRSSASVFPGPPACFFPRIF